MTLGVQGKTNPIKAAPIRSVYLVSVFATCYVIVVWFATLFLFDSRRSAIDELNQLKMNQDWTEWRENAINREQSLKDSTSQSEDAAQPIVSTNEPNDAEEEVDANAPTIQQRANEARQPTRRIANEPPLLVLMRDRFWVVWIGMIGIGSFAYWVLAWMSIGTIRRKVSS